MSKSSGKFPTKPKDTSVDLSNGDDVEVLSNGDDPRELIYSQEINIGPLPSPEKVKEYESILPGAAERIFSYAEKNQEDRHNENEKILKNDGEKIRGSMFVSLILIVVSAILAYLLLDNPLYAVLMFASSPAAMIVISLLKGRDK